MSDTAQKKQRAARIAELGRLMAEASCWGAYIVALDEERRRLIRA